jgi:transcriptional regulator with XRE-family HTH domain
MTLQELITERIYKLCGEKGITVNKLSVMSGHTQSTVDSILKGKSKNPQIRTLKKIANGFNMEFADFLNYIFRDDDEVEY